ncbi:MAG: DNA recombination protein RmuC, partial [Clostridia bacterium]|nr:DNA recombination protein RmuC [Clostridia bacterium]
MADINSILNSYTGALALLALVVLIGGFIALLVISLRQKKRLDMLEEKQEQSARETLRYDSYLQMSEMQSQRITQDQALRLQTLSQQLEGISAGQEQRLQHMQSQLDDKLNQNEMRMERMRETLHKSVNQLQEENSKKLEEMRITVDEKLHATLDKRLGESFQQVSQRLEMVYKGLGEMQTLASGVGDLKKVLTNVKTRGVWGEMQLGTLLAQVLSPSQYDENVAVVPGSTQRVEFAVKLPGQKDTTVYLPLDSKFPLEDYERLLAAYESASPEAVAAATAALQQALKTEAKRIASKYIQPPHTTDFAVMFLPIEGLYAEALRIRGLAETLQQQYRIVLAGPT